MSESASRHRQQLWRTHCAMARTLYVLQREAPMVQDSLHFLRRKCGKPTCRYARGHGHTIWVLTRSEAGQNRLYSVPPEPRGRLRPLVREYHRWPAGSGAPDQAIGPPGDLDRPTGQPAPQDVAPPKPDGPGTG